MPAVVRQGKMDGGVAGPLPQVRLSRLVAPRVGRRATRRRDPPLLSGKLTRATSVLRQGERRVFLFLLILCVSPITPALAADEPLPFAVLVTYHSRTGNTEKMARAVVDGARSVPGARVVLKRVGEVTKEDLFTADALIVGSPVYWSNMSGEVKTFFDNCQLNIGVFPEVKMRNKVCAAFPTGGQVSTAKDLTRLTIFASMIGKQMN